MGVGRGTGTVRETRGRGTSAVGTRHRRTGENAADSENCTDPLNAMVTCSYKLYVSNKSGYQSKRCLYETRDNTKKLNYYKIKTHFVTLYLSCSLNLSLPAKIFQSLGSKAATQLTNLTFCVSFRQPQLSYGIWIWDNGTCICTGLAN
jgi:hypothetical protein